MTKLEECARAAFDRHKYKYPERWEDLIPNIRESYIDDTSAVISRLIELTSDDSLRAMLQSVLDEGKE